MRHALRSYGLLLRWNLLRLRSMLPLLVVLQTLLSVGVVIGFSFLMPDADRITGFYLSTGALVLGLITVGMVAAPQLVAQAKLTGIFDYQRSMPVPRLAMLAADATVWVALALPGLVAALGVAVLRFDLDLRISWLVAPAMLLIAVCSVAIGYAIAYAARPEVAGAMSQLIFFVALMFAPINFPADRLPGWLAEAHEWLPFASMAQAVRETLQIPAAGISAAPFTMLLIWCVAGLAVTYRVMTHRP
ncbi:transport permease protein [Acrocarpospora phusangensis]|uniref:Transport permease protein n=1 Tax=Acrocarpospora phusangensis TaxID=1070424 RepID=A0A919QLN0_9ACTN|nr:ABC transporter permease [Acrocarpospora phusangensis]GIH29760.1 transport permease protein [Acrocarpospora phusangensis]